MWKLDYNEGWALKNRCFQNVVLKTLESPLDSEEKNQSILKEINPEYSLKELMLRLSSFGHLMWRADSWEKTLMLGRLRAGGEGDDRGWDGWMASPTQWTWVWVLVMDREAWPAAVHWVTKTRIWLSDWTELEGLVNYRCYRGQQTQSRVLGIQWLQCFYYFTTICLYGNKKWTLDPWWANQDHFPRNKGHGEGNGTPLQYSCLENPMDGGAW